MKRRRACWPWIAAVLVAALVAFALFAHPFLAINRPVAADILIVEGWVPDYVLAGAAREYKQGGYAHILVSGLPYEPGDARIADGSDAVRSARLLAGLGLDPSRIEACSAAATNWNRTSAMAFAVRDRLQALGLKPKGVNIVTLGPHARQTRLAFQRALGPGAKVGVISIPKDDYNPDRWWASVAGIRKTTKDFAGWIKELLFGRRA